MTILRSCQLLVIVATFYLSVYSFPEVKNNDKEALSGDFEKFLRDMESRVFKEKPKINKNALQKVPLYTTCNPNVIRSTNILHSQKAALRDVLMLKLVSYYEDKYKLAHHETTTSVNPSLKTLPPTEPMEIEIKPMKQHLKFDSVIADDIFNDIEDKASAEVVVI